MSGKQIRSIGTVITRMRNGDLPCYSGTGTRMVWDNGDYCYIRLVRGLIHYGIIALPEHNSLFSRFTLR